MGHKIAILSVFLFIVFSENSFAQKKTIYEKPEDVEWNECNVGHEWRMETALDFSGEDEWYSGFYWMSKNSTKLLMLGAGMVLYLRTF